MKKFRERTGFNEIRGFLKQLLTITVMLEFAVVGKNVKGTNQQSTMITDKGRVHLIFNLVHEAETITCEETTITEKLHKNIPDMTTGITYRIFFCKKKFNGKNQDKSGRKRNMDSTDYRENTGNRSFNEIQEQKTQGTNRRYRKAGLDFSDNAANSLRIFPAAVGQCQKNNFR